MRAIREGLVWLIPYLIVQSLVTFISAILQASGLMQQQLATLHRISEALLFMLPFLIASSISVMLSMQWQIPRPAVAFVNITYLVIADVMITARYGNSKAIIFFVSIFIPLLSVPIIGYIGYA